MNLHGTSGLESSVDRSRARKRASWGKLALVTLMGVFALLPVGCAATLPASTPVPPPAASPGVESTDGSTDLATQTRPAAPPDQADSEQVSARPITVTITEGSVARYLVREQLARLDFPIDAIGQTSQVSGAIAFDSTGQVVSESSRIVVNLESLTSDEERRDNFLRDNTLESLKFPTAEFVVRATPGLAWPLPTEGEVSFQLVGDLTLHGVTRPLTWDATTRLDGGTITGQARTNFPFEVFDLEVPRVRLLLSVDNNIRLELEFTGSVS